MRWFLALAACGALIACDAQLAEGPTRQAAHASVLAPHDLPAFFDCLRENSQTVVAAHRGGPAPGYAENAIATFDNTVTRIPALLEIDVARTRDGALVLMHDETVDRTTTGTGAVNDLTLAQFQALNLQDDDGQTLDAHPPTLRDALDWAAGKAILELDVKRGVAFEDVAAAVRDAGAQNRVVIITYSVGAARRMARVAPELMISTTIESEADLRELQNARVDLTRIIAWTGVEEPNAALNVALAQAGIEAAFGTLGGARSWDDRFAQNGEDQYAAFAETGLQLIATDRPFEAVRDLDANDGAEGYGAVSCATLQSPTGRYDRWISED